MKITSYRDNLLDITIGLSELVAGSESFSALDFGCGDGFFSKKFSEKNVFKRIVPVDVVKRKMVEVDPIIYDGRRLPFDNREFDLTYAIDVLHHCPSPVLAIEEICRCSKRWILIKDHCYSGFVGWLALYLMDEMGNRRFKIPSPGNYQRNWLWDRYFKMGGFELRHRISPARCHEGYLGRLTNRYQYVDLWERI